MIIYLIIAGETKQKDIVNFAKKRINHETKIGLYLNKNPTTISYHLDKLIKCDIVESYNIGKEKIYRLKKSEEIYDLYIIYGKKLFKDTKERVFRHLQKDFYIIVDNATNYFFDIFPHPYHV